MKRISLYTSILVFAAITLFSCKKEKTDRTILSSDLAANVLTLVPDSVINLDKNKADSVAARAKWTAPDYGFDNPSLKYEIQVDTKDNNFTKATAVSIPVTVGMEATMTQGQLDALAKGFGIADSALVSLAVRVKTTLANNSKINPVFSNTSNLIVRRYAPPPTKVYVAGDFQGWKPAEAPYINFNPATQKFEGIIDIVNPAGGGTGEFKFTSQANWDGPNYGAGATEGTLSTNASAGNLKVTPEGTYALTMDKVNLTWTKELVNWGLIGDATNKADLDNDGTPDGWQSDKNMKYNSESKMYEITLDLADGAIKFRKNDGWDTNYGDDGNNGSLEQNGANISVAAAGNYTIKLDVANKVYTITKN
jgi:starch-binding outer membrane protein SusE/F